MTTTSRNFSASSGLRAARERPLAPDGVVELMELRRDFPALARREGEFPVAYFDGPGGTQVPYLVAEAMVDYLYHHNANTHWAYPTSAETDAAIAAARGAVADLVNAQPSEIAFGANMTSLTFHLARGLGAGWSAGDAIVVTELDHHANVAPWRAVARERGLDVRLLRLDPASGELDLSELERVVTERTRLVAIGAASNALGTMSDLSTVVTAARAVGARVFVDAVHYAPHELIDVQRIGCDFLAFSGYKMYGPHVGVLYGREELLEAADVPRLEPAPDRAPDRLETGTQNHEGIVGLMAAIDFLAGLAGSGTTRRERLARAYAGLAARGRVLTARLWEGLAQIRGVRLAGPPPNRPRTPTVSFTASGTEPADLTRRLAAQGLFVSHGDFYAPTVLERLGSGPGGMVRVGCAAYTTVDEIDRLVSAVEKVVRGE